MQGLDGTVREPSPQGSTHKIKDETTQLGGLRSWGEVSGGCQGGGRKLSLETGRENIDSFPRGPGKGLEVVSPASRPEAAPVGDQVSHLGGARHMQDAYRGGIPS